jgi:hypothetical protein
MNDADNRTALVALQFGGIARYLDDNATATIGAG